MALRAGLHYTVFIVIGPGLPKALCAFSKGAPPWTRQSSFIVLTGALLPTLPGVAPVPREHRSDLK